MTTMHRIGTAALITTAAVAAYATICVSIDKDWMFGDGFPTKTATETAETTAKETLAETTETAENALFECETAREEIVGGTEATTEETTETTTAETTSTDETDAYIPHYTVDGCELDPELYEYLRIELSSDGIGWFLPYALCDMYQESRFDIYAEATNGLDKGLLQYRITYWDEAEGDIWDPYAQIRVYAKTMAKRIQSGESVEEALSDHYTGGVGYSEQYVSDVMQWLSTMREE